MCLGIPMQIVECHDEWAVCVSDGQLHRIDTMLVGEQPSGTWLLTFLGTAREVLTPENAVQISAALEAVNLAMRGDGEAQVDHLFPDLVDREPQLPAFLRNQTEEIHSGE